MGGMRWVNLIISWQYTTCHSPISRGGEAGVAWIEIAFDFSSLAAWM